MFLHVKQQTPAISYFLGDILVKVVESNLPYFLVKKISKTQSVGLMRYQLMNYSSNLFIMKILGK